MPRLASFAFLLALALPARAQTSGTPTEVRGFSGTWQLDAERSTAVDPWRDLTLAMDVRGDTVAMARRWRGSREGGLFTDSARVVAGGGAVDVRLGQWPDNRHLGAYVTGDSLQTVAARWADDRRTLIVERDLTLSVQQGTADVRVYAEYRLAPGGDRVDLLELRSTRPSPLHYVFRRDTTDVRP